MRFVKSFLYNNSQFLEWIVINYKKAVAKLVLLINILIKKINTGILRGYPELKIN